MSELSPRQRQILRAVVVEYVQAAEPVASELIASRYELGVRSATVRSELAGITDLGLLEQPHTSAGRIPSDRGYRYYVDRLLVPQTPDSNAQHRLEEATTEEDTFKEILRQTTKALSRLTHLLSVAATVRDAAVTVRSAVVTAIGPEKALFVFILQNGHVENRLMDCPPGVTLEHIGRVNEAIRDAVEGKPLGSVIKTKTPPSDEPVFGKLLRSVFAVLRATARELGRGRLITEGEEYIVAQPEFQRDAAALQALLKSLEDEETLYEASTGEGVTIGRENPQESMQSLAVLRRAFFVGDDEAGTLAVIGPTRMPYDRTMALLDFTAQAVSETLTRLAK